MNMMNIIQRGYTLFKNDNVGIVGEIMFRAEHFGCSFSDCTKFRNRGCGRASNAHTS